MIPAELREIAETVLPGTSLRDATLARGESHEVVLVPEVAAVRIARHGEAASLLPRRTALLQRLYDAGLPFEVPRPLGDVQVVAGRTAVATTWIRGEPAPVGTGDPRTLRQLLGALAAVPVADLADVLDEPHAYAGRHRWEHLMRAEVVRRMPVDLRAEVVRRVDVACALPAVHPGLVHGDLAGHNVHWDGDRLVGVLDWDLASAFDPAVDAACLAWHGWANVASTVDPQTLERARTWFDTFAIEQIAGLLARAAPEDEVAALVGSTSVRLRTELARRGQG